MQFDAKPTFIMDEECVYSSENLHLECKHDAYVHFLNHICLVMFHGQYVHLRKRTIINGRQRTVNFDHLPVNRCSFVRAIPQHKYNFIASIIGAHITRKINGFANERFHCNDGYYEVAKILSMH